MTPEEYWLLDDDEGEAFEVLYWKLNEQNRSREVMTIDTEQGALDHVPFAELVAWCNRYGLELVANTRGGLTLRRKTNPRQEGGK